MVERQIRSEHVESPEWPKCSVILVRPPPLINHGPPDPPNASNINDGKRNVLSIKALVQNLGGSVESSD